MSEYTGLAAQNLREECVSGQGNSNLRDVISDALLEFRIVPFSSRPRYYRVDGIHACGRLLISDLGAGLSIHGYHYFHIALYVGGIERVLSSLPLT